MSESDALTEAEMDALFDEATHDLLVDQDQNSNRERYERGPLYGYMGCKLTGLPKILPHLPYDEVFVDVFGGSGTVTLNRRQSKIEVFNDRHSGVVAFFRTLRDPVECQKLMDMIILTPYAREEFVKIKDEFYANDHMTDLERAHAWYNLVVMSYAGNSRTFQRWLPKSMSSRVTRLYERLPFFREISERFSTVLVENLDWRTCLRDYDSPRTVFYLDPPYIDANVYKLKMNREDHLEMCHTIMGLKGHVVLSGAPNDVYDRFNWDHHEKWIISEAVRTETDCNQAWSRFDAIYVKRFAN